MNKPNKCKNCQWYGKPYWSIINPCDSCPNENDYKTTIIVDGEPLFKKALTEEEIKKAMTDKSIFEITIEEKDKEIERLNNIRVKAIEYFKYQLEQLDFYEDTKAKMLCAMGIVILQGKDKDDN